MNKVKLSLAALLLVASAAISGPMIAQEEVIGGTCIYGEYRNADGDCYGATTRLCEGPSDCPVQAS